jgi:hypothetical protein
VLKILEDLEPAETKVKFEGSFDFLELKVTLLLSQYALSYLRCVLADQKSLCDE